MDCEASKFYFKKEMTKHIILNAFKSISHSLQADSILEITKNMNRTNLDFQWNNLYC